MKHSYCAQYKNCLIRPMREDDIELLRVWRNNTTLCRYLTPIEEITPDMQLQWYHHNQEDQNIVTFVVDEIENLHCMVGSASLYDFSDHCAEVGKTIIGDDEARGKSLGFYSELMTVYIGFEKLGLERIVARINEENQASMKRSHRLGYTVVGKHPLAEGGVECELECSKEQFYAAHPELSEIQIYMETEKNGTDMIDQPCEKVERGGYLNNDSFTVYVALLGIIADVQPERRATQW